MKGNTDWDVNPWTGEKDSKTYQEWRAHYEKQRKRRDSLEPSPLLRKVAMFSMAALVLPFVLLGISTKNKE